MSAESVEQLMVLARRALDSSLAIDEQIAAIESYAGAFDTWYGSIDQQTIAKDAVLQRKLQELAQLHAEVAGRAAKIQTDASQAVKNLRSRGKKILAYTPPSAGSNPPRRKG